MENFPVIIQSNSDFEAAANLSFKSTLSNYHFYTNAQSANPTKKTDYE